MTSVCGLIQDTALEALRGPNAPTRVATFGNSSVEIVGDWVEILETPQDLPQPVSGSGLK